MDAMNYALSHLTRYSYSQPVGLSHHVFHLSLPSGGRQRVATQHLKIEPEPAFLQSGIDYFGNGVLWVGIETPHTELTVALTAEIEVHATEYLDGDASPEWESVRDMLHPGSEAQASVVEHTLASPLAEPDDAVRAFALGSFQAGRPIASAFMDLTARIKAELAYRPGATEIHTPAHEVLARREGVCQDFSHLMIAAIRSVGLAARYVSGYIRSSSEGGPDPVRGADASHAWVDAWCGPEIGWVGFDPTNNLIASDQHVVVASGRDYNDVSPVRGVILGGGSHRLEVAVSMVAMEDAS